MVIDPFIDEKSDKSENPFIDFNILLTLMEMLESGDEKQKKWSTFFFH